MSHVTTDGPEGLVIEDSAIDQLRHLGLFLVTDGEKVILVGVRDSSAALKVADKSKVLDKETVHWVC